MRLIWQSERIWTQLFVPWSVSLSLKGRTRTKICTRASLTSHNSASCTITPFTSHAMLHRGFWQWLARVPSHYLQLLCLLMLNRALCLHFWAPTEDKVDVESSDGSLEGAVASLGASL